MVPQGFQSALRVLPRREPARQLGGHLGQQRVGGLPHPGHVHAGGGDRGAHPQPLERILPAAQQPDAVDLVEEIARHHGYEKIPADERAVTRGAIRDETEQVERRARELLADAGFFEARPLSLVDPAELERLRLIAPAETPASLTAPPALAETPSARTGTRAASVALPAPASALVAVENPLSSDQSVLRPSLLAGLAAALLSAKIFAVINRQADPSAALVLAWVWQDLAVVLLFWLFRKHIVSGLTFGAVKG